MNIAGVQFSLRDMAFEIYISGCKGVNGVHCKGCHNPQTWNPNYGTPLEAIITNIIDNIKFVGPHRVSVRILGGEPLDAPEEELKTLVETLKDLGVADFWLFTRYSLEETPEWARETFSFIKSGPYDETQLCSTTQYGVTLASSNQRIYKKGKDY